MIGLDTNILVRYFMRDDPAQYAKTRHLIDEVLTPQRPGYVSLIVLVEFIWVLGRSFRIDRDGISRAVSTILNSLDIRVEDEPLVHQAYTGFVSSRVDLADLIISLTNMRAGCEFTVSFDADAISSELMKAVTAV